MRTLVLNASFEPLGVVTLHRAAVLVLAERAEAVETSGRVIRSEHIEIDGPAVIRLKRMVRIPYRGAVPATRFGVLTRDNNSCGYCGAHADTIDHIMPRSRGGQNTWQNLVGACRPCNHKKSNRTPDEAGMILRVPTFEPSGTTALILAYGVGDKVWLPYLSLARTG